MDDDASIRNIFYTFYIEGILLQDRVSLSFIGCGICLIFEIKKVIYASSG